MKGILLSDRCLGRGYFHREGIERLLQLEQGGASVFFEIGKLVYAFDPFDAVSREWARGWENPDFPIYFDR